MIKIDEIIEGLELDFDESHYYYDVVNARVVMVTDEELRYAENEKDLMELPEWQKESVELADKILYASSKEFISLPDKHEVNEYRMMEHFIMTLELGPVRDELWDAISGRGAFRRFKDKAFYHGLDHAWYKYRDEAYKDFAKKWCESNNIEFEE